MLRKITVFCVTILVHVSIVPVFGQSDANVGNTQPGAVAPDTRDRILNLLQSDLSSSAKRLALLLAQQQMVLITLSTLILKLPVQVRPIPGRQPHNRRYILGFRGILHDCNHMHHNLFKPATGPGVGSA